MRLGPYEYDLIVRSDVNTRSYHQWFYFALGNTHPAKAQCGSVRYKFNIVNMQKPSSLFNHGMRPLRYSFRDAHKHGVGWVRSGDDVCYFQNKHPMPLSSRGGKDSRYYTLTFTMEFHNANDTYMISNGHPYGFTDVCRHTDAMLRSPLAPRILRRNGVANVVIDDLDEKQLIVELDQERLQTHNISLPSLGWQLNQNNTNISICLLYTSDAADE